MRSRSLLPCLLWIATAVSLCHPLSAGAVTNNLSPAAPANVVSRVGDRSVVLHWDKSPTPSAAGYNVYRALGGHGPFLKRNDSPLAVQSFADLNVTNEIAYFYRVRAVNRSGAESPDTSVIRVVPREFARDADFLEYVQQTAFDYFWYESNLRNGLMRDRSEPSSQSSIAAVGFGLTGIGIGIDHGWITREQGRMRVRQTLQTFWDGPQGTNSEGTIGYRGWFYHFLEMETATRAGRSELSSIDTALFLAGALAARQYFDADEPEEKAIRDLAGALYGRVDWNWMADGRDLLAMGWHPESGFLRASWKGYNEAMILYVLAIGAETNSVPGKFWENWTKTYQWQRQFGYTYLTFPPLFGHQYSHCWIDFRHLADRFMRQHGCTYFENSRRATLAQRNYCIANPGQFPGYSSNFWGLTACDGPGRNGFRSYAARGAPPAENDDGTLAPTAVGGSAAFVPEVSIPTLRLFYDRFRQELWTGYGFRDAFNLKANWWDPDVLGIDQGPILLMIENYRTQGVWRRVMRGREIHRGLERAGFQRVNF